MLTLKETQDIELEIMQKIHLFCEQEKITYCMTYGTLIGAVRHKGFIPWDNDIDIIMPRPDFDRFLETVKTKSIDDNLVCLHFSNNSKYHYQVIRVCDKRTVVYPEYIREVPEEMGVWVDIFVADGVPESIFDKPFDQLGLWFNKWVQLSDIYAIPFRDSPNKSLRGLANNIIKNVIHIIFPNKNNIHEYKVDHFGKRFKYEEYDHVADTSERQPPNWLTHEDFDNRVLMPFQQYEFYAPKDYDGYLSRYYGDYMQLPPEEKRMTHDIKAEWRNE